MISVIRHFYDGMRACVRLDDRVCSGWFAVEQALRQWCVLAPLLFNILFAAVIKVAYTRFKADKDIMDALVHLKKKNGRGGGGGATTEDPVLATLLRGMLYADDAVVVSQSPEQPRKMMGVIVVVCGGSGLTISEAKTEMMCLRTKGMLEFTVTFGVETAGQVYNQTNEFIYVGGNVNHNADLSIEVNRRIATHGTASGSTRSNFTTNRALPSSSIRMLRAEILETMLYGCVTWSPRACHYDTLRRAYRSFLTRCIGWRKNNRADHPISYMNTLIKTGSESIEALYAGDGSCSRGSWRAWRIRDCRSA